ncbi:hypothetical protein OG900_22610 [Streptomyces sp. NBC_00433]
MRARTMAGVALTACVALAVGACGPDKSKDDTGAEPSQSSASTPKAQEPSATPSASPRTETSSPSPTGDKSAPRTKAGAIKRYEVFLHAVGHEDIDTVCDVAGPAAKQAEDEGLGPCTSTFLVSFKMISPAQKKALQTATVDPKRVVMRSPDKVEIPVGAVKASMTFSEDELGDSTLEYLKNDWYITD